MTDIESATDTADELAGGEDAELVILTDWKVGRDGRLHIPKEKQDRYDIEEGDFVDAVLVAGEGE